MASIDRFCPKHRSEAEDKAIREFLENNEMTMIPKGRRSLSFGQLRTMMCDDKYIKEVAQ